MAKDPEQVAHHEWLGYMQPVGLVVSIPAMLAAQAHVNKNIAADHQRFLACLPRDKHDEPVPEIRDFPEFTRSVLGWEAGDLLGAPGGDPIPAAMEVVLPEYNETLRPTYAVRELQPNPSHPTALPAAERGARGEGPWLMLIQAHPASTKLDELVTAADSHWQATPHAKFERLLRETEVPAGLLFNGTQLRLVYAPRGESSGYMTFSVGEMATVAGRPIFAALHMLLCAERLFTLPEKQRLPAILAGSRKYQNVVSTKLSEQVLAALYELVRGFQAADDQRHGELLREVLAEDPNHVYGGLLTVLMRLVFVLYAEDRGLLSNDPVYTNFYSVTGLFDRLRADAGRFPDTMDQRYGAWAQLLTLFRLIYEGGRHGGFQIPARKGYLFDPDRYNFLEGRPWKTARRHLQVGVQASACSEQPKGWTPTLPRVADGVIFRVLSNLLILDGERLSYRTLDVEQIGSVYETMMGFNLEVAQGRSVALKSTKSYGAPATINLEELLATDSDKRAKWLTDQSDQKLAGQAADALKAAATIEDLLAALERKIAREATPNVVPKGAMILQPSDERRRSGSHYTPRSLTEPIVRTTLRPVLQQLESSLQAASSSSASSEQAKACTPTPEQILDLKICDHAMGSGAFLVETCRQLGDALVKAWHLHHCLPRIPADEDEVLHARRLIAQRCLYGVDKNPLAVDLAKLSLWLATLAKDHAFTFLDHSLRCGDSLVGLSREQIAAFHWALESRLQPDSKRKEKNSLKAGLQPSVFGDPIAERMRTVAEYRQRILAARDDKPYEQLRQELDVADEALSLARLAGDCVIAAYFSAGKDRERVAKLDTLARQLVKYLGPQRRIEDRQPLTEAVASLHGGDHPLQPFHWQIEFPEVFTRNVGVQALACPEGRQGEKQTKEQPKGWTPTGKPTGGFDAIVGNPPFAGKNTLINGNRDGYLDWLKRLHEESHGNADLVAHFFRRAFNALRAGGSFGLIATNTIGQGDTRSTGLRWICQHGGTIFNARKRYKWPGQAAVVVSVVHVCRGPLPGPFSLDGRESPIITAYLFHAGGHDDPEKLKANEGKSFQGSIVLGMGFTFDDTTTNGTASPLSLMSDLIARDSRNAERVFPFLGGEEVNSEPTHLHHRYVINFGDFPLKRDELGQSWFDGDEPQQRRWLRSGVVPSDYPDPVASDWPELLGIVEAKVKPQRLSDNRELYRRLWWQYCEKRIELYEKVRPLRRSLAMSEVTSHLVFSFVSSSAVYAHTMKVFPFEHDSALCVMQSRVHEAWGRFFASSLEERLRYTPTDCFDTFAFPAGVLEQVAGNSPTTDNPQLTALETAGREYYEFRAALMVRNNEGLTKTYNRFHDPHETSPDILQLRQLRELHAAMDRAVLEAYGWHDLAQTATCEFLLDYEEEEDDEEGSAVRVQGSGRQKKKPWRYRWPDDFRDEVLARLLELNRQRAEQERLAGLAAESAEKSKRTRKAKKKASDSSAGIF